MVLIETYTPFQKTGIKGIDNEFNGLPTNCVIIVYKDADLITNLFFHKILYEESLKGNLIFYYVSNELKSAILSDLGIQYLRKDPWHFYFQNEAMNFDDSDYPVQYRWRFLKELKEWIAQSSTIKEFQFYLSDNKIINQKMTYSTDTINICVNALNNLIKIYGSRSVLGFVGSCQQISRQSNGYSFLIINKGLLDEKELRYYKICKTNEVFIEMIREDTINITYSTATGRKEIQELKF